MAEYKRGGVPIPIVGGVVERLERGGREEGREAVEELPGQRLRHLLRRNHRVAAALPVEMDTATPATGLAAARRAGGEVGGHRLQAQRQQARRRRGHSRILRRRRHLRRRGSACAAVASGPTQSRREAFG